MQSVEEAECRRAYDSAIDTYNSSFDRRKPAEEVGITYEWLVLDTPSAPKYKGFWTDGTLLSIMNLDRLRPKSLIFWDRGGILFELIWNKTLIHGCLQDAMREAHENALKKAVSVFNASAVGAGLARSKFEKLLQTSLKKAFEVTPSLLICYLDCIMSAIVCFFFLNYH